MRGNTRHAADLANALGLQRAAYFQAALFLGRGVFLTASARTLADIRATAHAMEAQQPTYGRRAIITAIDPGGRAFHPQEVARP